MIRRTRGTADAASNLRKAAALSDLTTRNRLRAKIDMSAEAVTRRIRTVEALRRLCERLGRARKPA